MAFVTGSRQFPDYKVRQKMKMWTLVTLIMIISATWMVTDMHRVASNTTQESTDVTPMLLGVNEAAPWAIYALGIVAVIWVARKIVLRRLTGRWI